jgi:hypothetical protein
MGTLDTKNQGNPVNHIKGFDWNYWPGCGGKGGGLCVSPASFSYIWWTIRPSSYAVRNRHLVLFNQFFVPYTDGGYDPMTGCSHSDSIAQPYDMYLLYSANSSSAPDYTQATAHVHIPITMVPPFYLDFDNSILLPQENNTSWDGHIYVALNFNTTGLMLDGYTQEYQVFATNNLDFDERL